MWVSIVPLVCSADSIMNVCACVGLFCIDYVPLWRCKAGLKLGGRLLKLFPCSEVCSRYLKGDWLPINVPKLSALPDTSPWMRPGSSYYFWRLTPRPAHYHWLDCKFSDTQGATKNCFAELPISPVGQVTRIVVQTKSTARAKMWIIQIQLRSLHTFVRNVCMP